VEISALPLDPRINQRAACFDSAKACGSRIFRAFFQYPRALRAWHNLTERATSWWPTLSVFESVRPVALLFTCTSRVRRSRSPCLLYRSTLNFYCSLLFTYQIDTDVLSFRVVVKLHHRLDLASAHPHTNSFSIALIQPLSFLTSTHSFAQRTTPIYFSFNHLHTLSTATEGVGGTSSPNLPSFPRVYDLSPFFSYHCALFCTFLHSQKTQPPCFQSFPHSSPKNTRGGGVYCTPSRPLPIFSCSLSRPQRFDRGPQHCRKEQVFRQSRVTSHESPVTSFAHPSHCSQTPLVPQWAKAREIITIRGNNSATPGV